MDTWPDEAVNVVDYLGGLDLEETFLVLHLQQGQLRQQGGGHEEAPRRWPEGQSGGAHSCRGLQADKTDFAGSSLVAGAGGRRKDLLVALLEGGAGDDNGGLASVQPLQGGVPGGDQPGLPLVARKGNPLPHFIYNGRRRWSEKRELPVSDSFHQWEEREERRNVVEKEEKNQPWF